MASQRLKTRDPFAGGLPKLPDVSPRMSQGFGTAHTHRSSGRSTVIVKFNLSMSYIASGNKVAFTCMFYYFVSLVMKILADIVDNFL